MVGPSVGPRFQRPEREKMRVGVLAVQGDFAEHSFCLHKVYGASSGAGGVFHGDRLEVVEVRCPEDVADLHGIILPGGESTTIGHFLSRNNFLEDLRRWMLGQNGWRPVVWGTCAGLILLSNRVLDQKKGGQAMLGGIDITSRRNMYGRQTASFEAPLHLQLHALKRNADGESYNGVFIRAPGIQSVDSDKVQILATLTVGNNTHAVAVQQGNLIATAFHPELTDDLRWHHLFLTEVKESIKLRR